MKVKDLVNCSSEGFEVEVFRSGVTVSLYQGSILDIDDVVLNQEVDTLNVGQDSGKLYIGV